MLRRTPASVCRASSRSVSSRGKAWAGRFARWTVFAACLPCSLGRAQPVAGQGPAGRAGEPCGTFCNPLNLDYGWSAKGYRHSADPVIVLFKDRYYLFATDDLPGYRVSDDLLRWRDILFSPEQRVSMSDNERGTYCAPAAATDGKHLYFIRMSRGKVGRTVPVMRSADPTAGNWERCGELRVTSDPCLFFDDDGRAWLYHGLGQPTKAFGIDTATWREIPGSERQLRPRTTEVAAFFGGYERGRRELLDEANTASWLGRFKVLPCQEAAWMTKRDGRYYLQYATPGTVTQWYCDTVMEGPSATGPFREVPYAPVSAKVGGFMGSAGHSCVFRDRHGNWWRVTTMWVGVHDLFERRLGLFPVGFDAGGRMFTETAFGDYPQRMPRGPRDAGAPALAGWRVQSFGKGASASSSLPGHPPGHAADENCRTWWSAGSGAEGEWFQLDLGMPAEVCAVQVNFAEQDCPADAVRKGGGVHRYRLQGSADGQAWQPLAGDVRSCGGPHDYLELPVPRELRHLRVECVEMPAGGKFALRDVRVFGPGSGAGPGPVKGLKVRRHSDDDRNATLEWEPVAGADGYLVRFGIAPDKLWQAIQLQGGGHRTLTTHALNRGVSYRFRVDAFDGGGVSEGTPVAMP